MTRRDWLVAAAGMQVALARETPSAPVAVARCRDYGPSLEPALRTMLDNLGGLASIVRNKTVAIKINMTGGPRGRLKNVPSEDAHYTHPAVVGTLVRLCDQAGARRS